MITLTLKDETEKNILLFCAFRYALGRSTYVVGSIVNLLLRNWKTIPDSQKEMYKQEIGVAITQDRAGMQMDIDEWTRILNK